MKYKIMKNSEVTACMGAGSSKNQFVYNKPAPFWTD